MVNLSGFTVGLKGRTMTKDDVEREGERKRCKHRWSFMVLGDSPKLCPVPVVIMWCGKCGTLKLEAENGMVEFMRPYPKRPGIKKPR